MRASYSASIDEPLALTKEPNMKTSITTRLASMTAAAMMAVMMLVGINGLAVSDAPDALIARVAATQQA
jgi:hypothetical protein